MIQTEFNKISDILQVRPVCPVCFKPTIAINQWDKTDYKTTYIRPGIKLILEHYHLHINDDLNVDVICNDTKIRQKYTLTFYCYDCDNYNLDLEINITNKTASIVNEFLIISLGNNETYEIDFNYDKNYGEIMRDVEIGNSLITEFTTIPIFDIAQVGRNNWKSKIDTLLLLA